MKECAHVSVVKETMDEYDLEHARMKAIGKLMELMLLHSEAWKVLFTVRESHERDEYGREVIRVVASWNSEVREKILEQRIEKFKSKIEY